MLKKRWFWKLFFPDVESQFNIQRAENCQDAATAGEAKQNKVSVGISELWNGPIYYSVTDPSTRAPRSFLTVGFPIKQKSLL